MNQKLRLLIFRVWITIIINIIMQNMPQNQTMLARQTNIDWLFINDLNSFFASIIISKKCNLRCLVSKVLCSRWTWLIQWYHSPAHAIAICTFAIRAFLFSAFVLCISFALSLSLTFFFFLFLFLCTNIQWCILLLLLMPFMCAIVSFSCSLFRLVHSFFRLVAFICIMILYFFRLLFAVYFLVVVVLFLFIPPALALALAFSQRLSIVNDLFYMRSTD